MKIAFLSLYNGVQDRGVETFVQELATRLVKKGHTIDVFQAGSSSSESYTVHTIKLPIDLKQVRNFDLSTRFFLDYWGLLVLKFTLKVLPQLKNYDVVIPLNGGWQSVLTRLVTWLYDRKYVLVAQSGPGWDDRINLYTFPDIFVGFTNHQCNWAKKTNALVKVVKISNGVDTDKFSNKGTKLRTGLKKPVILSVGALTPIKRIDLLIQAVSKLKDTSLLLVGDGPLKGELEDLGKKLLGRKFEIKKVPYLEMPKVYRSADLFAYSTSPWESFGMVMLEAMATNIPVVASDDPIRREIIGNAGLLANVEDTQEYANKLKQALTKKWGTIPRKRAEFFSWKIITKKYEKLFNEILTHET